MGKKVAFGGFLLDMDGERIIALSSGLLCRVELGQMVTASGRFGVPRGTKGIVIDIKKPSTDGLTSDVIFVHFESHHDPLHMKFKDLLEFNPNP